MGGRQRTSLFMVKEEESKRKSGRQRTVQKQRK